MLNFIPKSSFSPPGLWLAVRMIPPSQPFFLIKQETAGVESIPFCPTISFFTLKKKKKILNNVMHLKLNLQKNYKKH